jgi:spore germination protein GerM
VDELNRHTDPLHTFVQRRNSIMINRQMLRRGLGGLADALARCIFAHRGAILFSVVALLALSACGTSTGSSGSPTATSTQMIPTATSQTPQATATKTGDPGYQIKVYFSKFPDSLQNYAAVFPVTRMSPTIAVATFSIQLLIAGPTLDERSAGYFSELNSILTGPSVCNGNYPTGGPDFTITLNMKGATAEQGTVTLQFCRATQSPGIGADARIKAEITATLLQFPNIKKVVILTSNGRFFGNESSADTYIR